LWRYTRDLHFKVGSSRNSCTIEGRHVWTILPPPPKQLHSWEPMIRFSVRVSLKVIPGEVE
jgi:hypothetical protein